MNIPLDVEVHGTDGTGGHSLALVLNPVEVTCSKTAAGWFYYGPCPSGAVPVQ